MQAVEQHPYVEQVLAPIAGESAMGVALDEDVCLEFLENEIMKIGSLAHTGIDWAKVERESLQLLADRSKNLKVLGYLLLCLQRGGNGERYALSLYLLNQVLDGWWAEAWPYPAAKGQRARKLLFGQILQRAEAEVDKLSFDAAVGDGRSYCLTVLDRLIAQAGDLGLPDESLYDLKRQVERLPTANQAPVEQASPATPMPASVSPGNEREPTAAATTMAASPALANLTLDAGNERATRQSLLKVAELLTELSPTDPLGYQLRRYAIWSGITAPPPSRSGGKTDLAAVSADRVADYREALAKGPDLDLWQRIEQSLSLSPFWLEGHWLSGQVADALGHGDCSEAIRSSLRSFLERLPALEPLTFNDGTPFLPKDAADWLLTSPVRAGSASAGWQQAYEQATELLPREGLGPAMQRLEDGLADAKEPRDQFYWRLMSSELLREGGMTTLARQQVRDLQEQSRNLTLADWEPGLIARLERLA